MSRPNPMALFDREPIAPESEERPAKPPSKRELDRLRAAEHKAERGSTAGPRGSPRA